MLTVNKQECIEATVLTIFWRHYRYFDKDQCVDGVFIFEVCVDLSEVCEFFERLFHAFPKDSITYTQNRRGGDVLSRINIEVGIRYHD